MSRISPLEPLEIYQKILSTLRANGFTDHERHELQSIMGFSEDFSKKAFLVYAYNFTTMRAFRIIVEPDGTKIDISHGTIDKKGFVTEKSFVQKRFNQNQLASASKFFEGLLNK